MDLSSAATLAFFFLLCFGASASGAIFKPGEWYARLDKPSWTPPNWMFPVVWSILFALMAVAAWRVWEASGIAAWPALLLFVVHLAINAVWSFLFFGRKRLDWAMIEVLALWLAILAVIFAFDRHDAIAPWLLVPYIAWVTIAAALNWRLLQLNGPRGKPA
jgi:benzodiazapine receptor